MKKIIFFIYMIFFAGFFSAASDMNPDLEKYFGEKLYFKVSWFGIYAGDAYLSVKKLKYQEKPIIRFKAKINSAKWFSSIYYVEDNVETIVDIETLKTIEMKVDYREGKKYSRQATYSFDYDENKMYAQGDPKVSVLDLSKEFVDMFVAFYLLREHSFEQDKEFSKVVHDGRKLYALTASFEGNKEVKTAFGVKKCFKINPGRIKLDLLGQNQKPYGIKLYLMQKQPKVPMLAIGDIKIGSIKAKLVKYKSKNFKI